MLDSNVLHFPNDVYPIQTLASKSLINVFLQSGICANSANSFIFSGEIFSPAPFPGNGLPVDLL